MLNKPIKANSLGIKMFLPAASGSRQMTVEAEVNKWLKEQKEGVHIYAIFYQHCTTPKPVPKPPTNISEDKVSVMVVFGSSGYAYD